MINDDDPLAGGARLAPSLRHGARRVRGRRPVRPRRRDASLERAPRGVQQEQEGRPGPGRPAGAAPGWLARSRSSTSPPTTTCARTSSASSAAPARTSARGPPPPPTFAWRTSSSPPRPCATPRRARAWTRRRTSRRSSRPTPCSSPRSIASRRGRHPAAQAKTPGRGRRRRAARVPRAAPAHAPPAARPVESPRQGARDAEYGHQDGEINFWIPLTDPDLTGVTLEVETAETTATGPGSFEPAEGRDRGARWRSTARRGGTGFRQRVRAHARVARFQNRRRGIFRPRLDECEAPRRTTEGGR